jgi:hypothetical protein
VPPGTAQSENLPDFFKVDLKAKTIRAEDKGAAVTHQADRSRRRPDHTLRFGGRTLLDSDDPREDRADVSFGQGRWREFRDLRCLPAVGRSSRSFQLRARTQAIEAEAYVASRGVDASSVSVVQLCTPLVSRIRCSDSRLAAVHRRQPRSLLDHNAACALCRHYRDRLTPPHRP